MSINEPKNQLPVLFRLVMLLVIFAGYAPSTVYGFQQPQDEFLWNLILKSASNKSIHDKKAKITSDEWTLIARDIAKIQVQSTATKKLSGQQIELFFTNLAEHNNRMDYIVLNGIAPLLFYKSNNRAPREYEENSKRTRIAMIKTCGNEWEKAIRIHQFFVWSSYTIYHSGHEAMSLNPVGIELSDCKDFLEQIDWKKEPQKTNEFWEYASRVFLLTVAFNRQDLAKKLAKADSSPKIVKDVLDELTKWLRTKPIPGYYLDRRTRTWSYRPVSVLFFHIGYLGAKVQHQNCANVWKYIKSNRDPYFFAWRSREIRSFSGPFPNWKDESPIRADIEVSWTNAFIRFLNSHK